MAFPAFRSSILAAGVALVAVAGCSSGSGKATPATSTSAAPTTTSVPVTTTTPASTTTATSAPATSGTGAPTPTTSGSSVRITGFTVSPATPVCNAPTMVQLSWTSVGATSVDLSIDGSKFASYGPGAQSHLEYYACDGRPHTYVLTGHGPTGTDTATKTVTSTSS